MSRSEKFIVPYEGKDYAVIYDGEKRLLVFFHFPYTAEAVEIGHVENVDYDDRHFQAELFLGSLPKP